MVSDIEKTILDGLARPRYCGGVKEIARALWAKQNKIDWDKMIVYAARFSKKSALKRLGFLIELLGLHSPCSIQLKGLLMQAKDYVNLDPQLPQTGKYLAKWRLRINMNPEELKKSVWE